MSRRPSEVEVNAPLFLRHQGPETPLQQHTLQPDLEGAVAPIGCRLFSGLSVAPVFGFTLKGTLQPVDRRLDVPEPRKLQSRGLKGTLSHLRDETEFYQMKFTGSIRGTCPRLFILLENY